MSPKPDSSAIMPPSGLRALALNVLDWDDGGSPTQSWFGVKIIYRREGQGRFNESFNRSRVKLVIDPEPTTPAAAMSPHLRVNRVRPESNERR
jgi:hypothetical protein